MNSQTDSTGTPKPAIPDWSRAIDPLCNANNELVVIHTLANAAGKLVGDYLGIIDQPNDLKTESRIIVLTNEIARRLHRLQASIDVYIDAGDEVGS